MTTKIVVNGRTYSRIEDVPAEFRKLLEGEHGLLADADGNGIPDIVEQSHEGAAGGMPALTPGATRSTHVVQTKYVVNGREYASMEEMPAEDRAAMRRVSAMMGGTLPTGEAAAFDAAQDRQHAARVTAAFGQPSRGAVTGDNPWRASDEPCDPFAARPNHALKYALVVAALAALAGLLIWKFAM